MGKYVKKARLDKYRKPNLMNEEFFYDPYEEKILEEMTINAMHQMMLAIKAFGIECKRAIKTTKEINDAMRHMGRCSRT